MLMMLTMKNMMMIQMTRVLNLEEEEQALPCKVPLPDALECRVATSASRRRRADAAAPAARKDV